MVTQPPFPVLLWLWNSIKIATMPALLIVAISTMAAYAFARMQFRHKHSILSSMLLLQLFPVAVALVALVALVAIYAIFEDIGARLPWPGHRDPRRPHRGLSRRRGHAHLDHQRLFETIPVEIEENAKVDGVTHWQVFRQVLLPMAVPILMVVFVLAFISSIIEYPGGQHPAARRAQSHAGRGQQVLPLRTELPVRRLCRSGRAQQAAHYLGVLAGAALDRVGPDGRRSQGMRPRWAK